jgi:F-type H+-transporting ATPase subunit b
VLSLNGTFLVQMGIVLTVMVSLYLILFRPLGRQVDRRREAFSSLEKEASAKEAAAAATEAELQTSLESLKNEVLAYKAGVKGELDRERTRIVATAREKADIILKREAEDLRRELESARDALQGRSRELGEAVFTRLMGRPPAPGKEC